jgi:hypothetical protein
MLRKYATRLRCDGDLIMQVIVRPCVTDPSLELGQAYLGQHHRKIRHCHTAAGDASCIPHARVCDPRRSVPLPHPFRTGNPTV